MIAKDMRALTDKVEADLIEEARNSDRYKYLLTKILESSKRGQSCIYFTEEPKDKYCIQVLESEGFIIAYSNILTLNEGSITRVWVKW